MKTKHLVIAISAVVIAGSSVAYAGFVNPREAVEFFRGHTHDDGQTIHAPQHGGGLDRYGCHNGSVPYHCHR